MTRVILLLFILLFFSCKKENPVSAVFSPPPTPTPTNLNLISIGNLSKARYFIKAGATSNKILFAGGMYGEDCFVPGGDYGDSMASVCISNTTRVDIYDIGTRSWSVHELPRYYTGPGNAITVDNRVYFSGGMDTAGRTYSNKVDVYDGSKNIWSTISLSDSRSSPTVASIGNKIFFAGGYNYPAGVSNKVDIYDVSSNSFSAATLSEARIVSAAVVVGHKILFTGGGYGGWGPVSHTVDIYDDDTKSWSVSQLSVAKSGINAFVIGNEAFFAGIEAPLLPTGSIPISLSKMDIYNQLTNSWSVKNLDFFTYYLSPPPAVINKKALVFNLPSVHIYNAPTGNWTTSVLNMELGYAAIIAVGNSIFIAGGGRHSYGGNQVYKMEF